MLGGGHRPATRQESSGRGLPPPCRGRLLPCPAGLLGRPGAWPRKVVQEVFLRLWHRPEKVRPRPGVASRSFLLAQTPRPGRSTSSGPRCPGRGPGSRRTPGRPPSPITTSEPRRRRPRVADEVREANVRPPPPGERAAIELGPTSGATTTGEVAGAPRRARGGPSRAVSVRALRPLAGRSSSNARDRWRHERQLHSPRHSGTPRGPSPSTPSTARKRGRHRGPPGRLSAVPGPRWRATGETAAPPSPTAGAGGLPTASGTGSPKQLDEVSAGPSISGPPRPPRPAGASRPRPCRPDDELSRRRAAPCRAPHCLAPGSPRPPLAVRRRSHALPRRRPRPSTDDSGQPEPHRQAGPKPMQKANGQQRPPSRALQRSHRPRRSSLVSSDGKAHGPRSCGPRRRDRVPRPQHTLSAPPGRAGSTSSGRCGPTHKISPRRAGVAKPEVVRPFRMTGPDSGLLAPHRGSGPAACSGLPAASRWSSATLNKALGAAARPPYASGGMSVRGLCSTCRSAPSAATTTATFRPTWNPTATTSWRPTPEGLRGTRPAPPGATPGPSRRRRASSSAAGRPVPLLPGRAAPRRPSTPSPRAPGAEGHGWSANPDHGDARRSLAGPYRSGGVNPPLVRRAVDGAPRAWPPSAGPTTPRAASRRRSRAARGRGLRQTSTSTLIYGGAARRDPRPELVGQPLEAGAGPSHPPHVKRLRPDRRGPATAPRPADSGRRRGGPPPTTDRPGGQVPGRRTPPLHRIRAAPWYENLQLGPRRPGVPPTKTSSTGPRASTSAFGLRPPTATRRSGRRWWNGPRTPDR